MKRYEVTDKDLFNNGPPETIWNVNGEDLIEIPEGSALITQEQAHKLMSLSSERSRVPLEYLDSKEARQEACKQITEEIDRIWNEVFHANDS